MDYIPNSIDALGLLLFLGGTLPLWALFIKALRSKKESEQ